MTSIEYELDHHLATVTLNRPQALNAINAEMDDRLLEIWEEVNRNPDIWLVVLRAAGEKAFCSGADIRGGHKPRRMALGGGLTGVGGPLFQLKKPMIAAVQGYALGGGFELAMCADIIVAADTAQFGIPEARAGIMGESGIMHRAIRQLPHRIATAMIVTGERMNAQSALQFGLVNEVVPFEKLVDTTKVWADRVLAGSPLAIQAAKQAVLSRRDLPLEIALATRYEPIENYAYSQDVVEGQRAFAEKRKPQWSGR